MAWIKIIFLAFCLNSGTIHADHANDTGVPIETIIHASNDAIDDQGLEKAAHDALERCQQWIWKQADPRTDFWAGGEVVTAIMGVLKDVIELRGLKYGNRTRLEGKDLIVVKPAEVQNAQSKIVAQNIEIAHLEFFKRLRSNGGEISEIPDDYLSQLAMVLGLTCLHDPKDYFGYNLIDELYNRAKKTLEDDYYGEEGYVPEIQFPALVTVLCSLKDFRIAYEGGFGNFLSALAYPTPEDFGDNSELNLERAAMNMIAASCLYRSDLQYEEEFEHIRDPLLLVLQTNSRFINSVQEEDGGFGNVYSTALALHAQRQSPLVCCSDKSSEHSTFRNADALQWLLDAQKPDGSVGSSITFTSLSVLAFESSDPFNALQNIQSVDCEGIWANKNKSKIAVEFSDTVYSKMTFTESIPAKIGDNLKVLLENFAENNPKTLKLDGELIQDTFYQITSINNIEDIDELGHSWLAYKVFTDGTKELITDLREVEIEDMDVVFLFEYV